MIPLSRLEEVEKEDENEDNTEGKIKRENFLGLLCFKNWPKNTSFHGLIL